MRGASSIAWACLVLAGCSNPFLEHYRGARCPEVSSAHVATQAPVDATLIGHSDFTTGAALGDVEAIGAARAVGSNIVQWDRAFLRDDVVLSRDATLAGGMDEMSTTGAAGPEEGTWYRIHARFWRSNALGSIPEPARDAAASTPAAPVSAPPAVPPDSAPTGTESNP